MSAIGIGRVIEGRRITLSAPVLNALQLRKMDQLFFYFDYGHESEGAGARLVGLPFPVTVGSFQGETRGSHEEVLDLIQRLSQIGKFEVLFIRRGRTKEYSLNYVISVRSPEDEKTLGDILESVGKPIFNQRLISLGEGGKIGEACFKRLIGKVPFTTTIDARNRVWIPANMDKYIVEKLGLDSAKRSIQTADPGTERLILVFTPTEKLIDLTFTLTELSDFDLSDFMQSLLSLRLIPQALVKRTVPSPVKCRVRAVLDYSNTQLGCLPKATKEILNQELKSSINEGVHEIQGKRGEKPGDVVIDVELSVPLHEEEREDDEVEIKNL